MALERRWPGWATRRAGPWWALPGEEEWMPAVDVFEKEGKLVVKAELPGMKQEDIDVSIVGDTLTIRGQKESEKEVKEEDYYRSERSYGSFYRSIPLPSTADTKKIEATYENGVLEVTVPKASGVTRKRVTVAAKKKAAAPTKEEKAG